MTFLDRLKLVIKFFQESAALMAKIMWILVLELAKVVIPREGKKLEGEVILVTGSAHGIGRQLVKRCAEMGAKVVLWDINKKIEIVAEEIKKDGGKAWWYICDVSSEDSVKSAAQKVMEEVGDVTILVNNAGLMQNVPFLELDSDRIRKTLEVNILAHFWTIRAFLPKMLEKNRGHIVAIASAAGIIGHVNQSDYSASKFGVVGMMEGLSEELRLAKSPIRCTTICPMTVDTGMNENPVAKYPFMTPILSIDEAADGILNAIRREEFLVTIPRRIRFLLCFVKIFPHKILSEMMDFLDYCRLQNHLTDNSQQRSGNPVK